MIVIVDYNVGNVGSIYNMITKIGYESIISNDKNIIASASKLILPGVGSFDNGIQNLQNLDLFDVLNKKVLIDKIPILGICLGMQLMAESSDEGEKKGLGWISQNVEKIKPNECKLTTIPILGWNYINVTRENKLISSAKQRYYFVHSYYFTKHTPDSIANANVGFDYCAAFQKDNIFGVQFHPEKSHVFGKNLLDNFCKNIK